MTRAAPSLRWRLILANAGLFTVCMLAFSLLVYAAFSRTLAREFDARLAADAATVAHMVENNADGSWEFEGLREFQDLFDDGYFEVHLDDGQLFARSRRLEAPLLGDADWDRAPRFEPVSLPDGDHGRVLLARLMPRAELTGKSSGRHIYVSIARSMTDLEATLAQLRLYLWGFGFSALATATAVCVWTMGRGLKPLTWLLTRVDQIDVRHLGERLPVAELPRELQPLASKLNELLTRIGTSVAREREWNVAVSHELRTPLAGLRTILDVSVSRERSASEYQDAIEDALRVVVQLNQLIDQLLMLARLDANAWEVASEPIPMRSLVEDCCAPYLQKIRSRRLNLDNHLPEEWVLRSDFAKLRLVVSNLISNAVEYSSEGAKIRIDHEPEDGTLLRVSNTGPPLPEHALTHMFEPFVRLESSRFGSAQHSGIGLTLVRALCEVLGLAISAENRAGGWVSFVVRERRA